MTQSPANEASPAQPIAAKAVTYTESGAIEIVDRMARLGTRPAPGVLAQFES